MSDMNIESALILAAGQGSRMGDLGRDMPKALAPVLNKPLVVRHLELLARAGVRDVHIVVGHLGDKIRDALAAHRVPGLNISYHVQAERLGLGHAMLQAEKGLAGQPFVLLLADIAFTRAQGEAPFVLPDGVSGLIAVKDETDVDAVKRNFSVILDEGNRIQTVIEKPKAPPTMLKGTGQYVFRTEIFDAIRGTPRSSLRNEYELTDSIQTLIDQGHRVHIDENRIVWDLNLTYPADLLDCNRHYLTHLKDAQVMGTELPEGSRIVRSVVGQNVQADGAVDLEDCVVLDGAHLAAGVQLRNAVVGAGWRLGGCSMSRDYQHALVTGGAGFIGAHLVRALLADGLAKSPFLMISVSARVQQLIPRGALSKATCATPKPSPLRLTVSISCFTLRPRSASAPRLRRSLMMPMST